jgi:hypothetical protein
LSRIDSKKNAARNGMMSFASRTGMRAPFIALFCDSAAPFDRPSHRPDISTGLC